MGNRYNLKHTGCVVEGCTRKHYARGYCRKHHAAFILRGGYKFGERGKGSVQCSVLGCSRPGRTVRGYCKFHYSRFRAGVPLDLRYNAQRGERNGNWNGGTSDYPDHTNMKKLRKILLPVGKLCICGQPAEHIHHLDGGKVNHTIVNLVALCRKCHGAAHAEINRNKKIKKILAF